MECPPPKAAPRPELGWKPLKNKGFFKIYPKPQTTPKAPQSVVRQAIYPNNPKLLYIGAGVLGVDGPVAET